MSIKINSLVEIPFLEIKGKVIEIDDNGGYLVEHNAEIDGRRKTIQQWYNSEICKEIKENKVERGHRRDVVKDTYVIGVDVAKEEDVSVEAPIKVELGVIPEEENTEE